MEREFARLCNSAGATTPGPEESQGRGFELECRRNKEELEPDRGLCRVRGCGGNLFQIGKTSNEPPGSFVVDDARFPDAVCEGVLGEWDRRSSPFACPPWSNQDKPDRRSRARQRAVRPGSGLDRWIAEEELFDHGEFFGCDLSRRARDEPFRCRALVTRKDGHDFALQAFGHATSSIGNQVNPRSLRQPGMVLFRTLTNSASQSSSKSTRVRGRATSGPCRPPHVRATHAALAANCA